MTKKNFLEALKAALIDRNVSKKILEDTLKEYESMIDDALESGESIDGFIKRMGTPEKVAKVLARNQRSKTNKLVAISPFIATIAFFFIGVFYQAWHPGWLVFLFIPITSILASKNVNWRGLLVFAILIVFVFLGSQTNLYNPLWSLFLLLIPFSSKQNSIDKRIRFIAMVYTVLAVILYHIWVLQVMFTIGNSLDPFELIWPLSILLPIIVYAFINGTIQISFKFDLSIGEKKSAIVEVGLVLGLIILYIALGIFIPGFWHPGWLIFLLIPIVFIWLEKKKFPLVDISPFLATILFVLVGEYVTIPGQDSSYALSWLFFLLIPITSILMEKGD